MTTATAEWTQIAMFAATAVLVLITLTATVVNYLALRAAVDPDVIVYTNADEARPRLIQLVIENTGKRIARNVRFSLSEPIPNRTAGLHGSSTPGAGNMDSGPLFSGISALGPGAKRVMTWGVFPALHGILGDRSVSTGVQHAPVLFSASAGELSAAPRCAVDL